MQIVAIMLVRNEDQFIGQALVNILEFCDKIILADHESKDKTASIVNSIRHKNPKIDYHKIARSGDSHLLIEKYINTDTWIFGVDGDEVYDPAGLKIFREKLIKGEFFNEWQIFGNVLNCVNIDYEIKQATGYLSPPSRSMTKLYNFRAIKSWDGDISERLHGGHIVFHDAYNDGMRLALLNEYDWDNAFFRCLHTCFLRRSSLDRENNEKIYFRPNPVEINHRSPRDYLFAAIRFFAGKQRYPSKWKMEKYMRGTLFSKDVSMFFERRVA